MRKSVRASYTIEASLIMPVLVFLTAFVMERAIEMYRETSEELREGGEICITEPVRTVRRIKCAGEIAEVLKWK